MLLLTPENDFALVLWNRRRHVQENTCKRPRNRKPRKHRGGRRLKELGAMRIHRQRRPTRSRITCRCPNVCKGAPRHASNQGHADAALPEPAAIQSRIDHRYSKNARGIRRPTGVELDSELTFDTRLPCISADLVPAGFPFGNTTKGNPERRLSARTLRATRAKARSARTTNSGAVFLPFAFLALMKSISCRANLYHCPCSWRAVSEKSASLCQHLAELPCLHLLR